MIKTISELKPYESPKMEVVTVYNGSSLLAGSLPPDSEQGTGWSKGEVLE